MFEEKEDGNVRITVGLQSEEKEEEEGENVGYGWEQSILGVFTKTSRPASK